MTRKKGLTISRRIARLFSTAQNSIYSASEFRAIVTYERTRTDRNGSVFSIAVLSVESGSKAVLESKLEPLSQLIRSIDCVGWDDENRIAILLPDTNREGAEIFVKKLLEALNDGIDEPLLSEIYTYPEHWLANEDGGKNDPFSIKNSIEFLFVKKVPHWKRGLDIIGSLMLFLIFSPVFVFLSLYIKLISPGPIFFKQVRIGYKGRPFTFWKFRTMKFDNNQSFHGKHAQSFIKNGDIPMEKLDGRDPRIIIGGKVIRKCCLDELPQLWNVLRGDMSLVGPRPCIPYEAKEYLRWHTHRFDTAPGLSGLWQVSGKNKLTFKQMIRLDIAYCRNISLLSDLKIIFMTPIAIAKMIIEATMGKFMPHDGEQTVIPISSFADKKAQ